MNQRHHFTCIYCWSFYLLNSDCNTFQYPTGWQSLLPQSREDKVTQEGLVQATGERYCALLASEPVVPGHEMSGAVIGKYKNRPTIHRYTNRPRICAADSVPQRFYLFTCGEHLPYRYVSCVPGSSRHDDNIILVRAYRHRYSSIECGLQSDDVLCVHCRIAALLALHPMFPPLKLKYYSRTQTSDVGII